jgi:signal peptidase II
MTNPKETPVSPPPPTSGPTFTRRPTPVLIAGIVGVLALTALDLGTKSWAEENLSRPRRGETPPVCEPGEDGWSEYQRMRDDSVVWVEDWLELEYAENCGAAFSLLHGAPHQARVAIFSLAAFAAIVVLSFLFASGRGGIWLTIGAPLVVSGALGNLIDRLRYGYVVDFVHFEWPGLFDYPVFNVADIGVVVGVICLVIDGWRSDPKAATLVPAAASVASRPVDEAPDEEDEEDEADESTQSETSTKAESAASESEADSSESETKEEPA